MMTSPKPSLLSIHKRKLFYHPQPLWDLYFQFLNRYFDDLQTSSLTEDYHKAGLMLQLQYNRKIVGNSQKKIGRFKLSILFTANVRSAFLCFLEKISR